MDKPVSRLAYLFGLYTANTLTAAERREFLAMIRQPVFGEELNGLITAAVENGVTDRTVGAHRADQLFESILQGGMAGAGRLKEGMEAAGTRDNLEAAGMAAGAMDGIEMQEKETRVVPMRRKAYMWWVAAASVIVLAGATYFFSQDGRKEQKLVAGPVRTGIKNEIIPAGNKAMLTLDNGSTIVLDSASSGTLAMQGNTHVVKLDAGKLAYNEAASYKVQAASEEGEVASGKIFYNTIVTPRGGQYQVVLPDGTGVWLNAASSLKFPTHFTGEKREVVLTGEAYFEIAKNKSMPFIVSVGQAAVKVLGTHFNINGYKDENNINTTLLEGAVAFSSGGSEKVLRPGQQAVYNNADRSVLVQHADVNQVMGWKNGFFEFDNTELSTIMRQISRWYDVDIVYGTTDKDIKLGGGISRKSGLQDLIRLLESNGVYCKIEGRTLVVNTRNN